MTLNAGPAYGGTSCGRSLVTTAVSGPSPSTVFTSGLGGANGFAGNASRVTRGSGRTTGAPSVGAGGGLRLCPTGGPHGRGVLRGAAMAAAFRGRGAAKVVSGAGASRAGTSG